MKIRSAVPENGCLIVLVDGKNKKNNCKTYMHPPPTGRRLRKTTTSTVTDTILIQSCSKTIDTRIRSVECGICPIATHYDML